MGIKDALAALTGREVKAAPVPGADVVLGSVAAQSISNAQVDAAMEGAARYSSVLAAALTWTARNFAEAPLVVLKGGEPDYAHPLSRAFARPTPWHSQTWFWQRFVMLLLTDRRGAYILGAKDDADEIATLWARASRHIRPVLSETDYISGWEFVRNGYPQRVDETRYVVCRQQFPSPEPDDEMYSFTPLEQIRKEVRTHATASLWLDSILQNMGVTSGMVGIDHPALDPATARSVQDDINERVGGYASGGKFVVLAGKLSVHEMGMRLADVDFGPLIERLEVATARAFGMPLELLQSLATAGKGEGLNASAYREKASIAYRNGIVPLWKDVAETVATFIGPLYGLGPEDVAFDYSGIEAVAEDLARKVDTAARMLAFATYNEARTHAGLPAEAWGEVNPQAALYGRLAATPPAKAATERKTRPDALARAVAFEAKARGLEPAFERAARKVFAAEERAVQDAIAGLGSAQAISEAAAGAVTAERWEEGMVDALAAAYAQGYADVSGMLSKADASGVTGLADPDAIAAVARRATKLAGLVTDTTRKEIRAAVTEAVSEGLPLEQIAERIRERAFGGEITKARAITIARTESLTAMSEGGLIGARRVADDTGLAITKSWITAGNDARGLHLAAEAAGPVPLDSDFGVGAQHPGGFGIAAEDINCRCTLVYDAE